MIDSRTVGQYGTIAVSIQALLIFIAVLIVALVLRNEQMLLMLVGAAINMAGTAVQFWLGSSASSQKKDEVIANSRQA